MVLEDTQKGYPFPRIPLNLQLPDNYPDVERISSITVTPEIKDIRYNQEEMEIKGIYQVAVSYFRAGQKERESAMEPNDLCVDEFFSYLKLQDDGLFVEDDDEESLVIGANKRELYTASFIRSFHTFVDLEYLGQPAHSKPLMVVDKVELLPEGHRVLRGELFLELVSKNRGNSR